MPIPIEQLRARIRAIERSGSGLGGSGPRGWNEPALVTDGQAPAARDRCREQIIGVWDLGSARDASSGLSYERTPAKLSDLGWLLGRDGLDIGAVHEIKPAAADAGWVTAWSAARTFALALSVRRLIAAAATGQHSLKVLWCAGANATAEFGIPYGPGLHALGLDPACLIVVEPARAQDTLWVLEQALSSACLALVVAQIDEVGLTPARRLALAAARSRTPCLMITHPRSPATAATATRWRIGPAPSAPQPFTPCAPGAARFAVSLERCRSRAPSAGTVPLMLEWSDAASCFRLASDVADRAYAPGRSDRRAASGGG